MLIVDDSAFMRYTIGNHLSSYPEIQVVGSARDGNEALALIPRLKPDVVTLDVEMPNLDGLSTLRQIMAQFPRPVIMLSSLTKEGAIETVQALTIGAVDFVAKPSQKANIGVVMDEVAAKILKVSRARVSPVALPVINAVPVVEQPRSSKKVRSRMSSEPIVVIGSSTGGPRALNTLIPALSADLPAPIMVVQHMPAGFTHSLAERLNTISRLAVKEAQPGDRLEVGKVLIAPGGFHLTFNEQEKVELNQHPPVHGVRPAIDVTLTSIIQRYGKAVIAVILTGMGSDGTNGSVLLHSMGGKVIAEAESTCVVWGMPRSVAEAGAADIVAPLPEIAGLIEQAVRSFKPQS